ncbi:nicotinamidase [Dendroctonus ponderosae]|uniref:nicotinamidase n=1 Tax=Dendroctonus ponderosae TaxID=77166 RepID=UPI00203544B7|nr:nicotinamidase [Dendroctonus ponderosae]
MSSTNSIDLCQLPGSRTSTFPSDGMDACFAAFDKNCDGWLNYGEFKELCKALFRDAKGNSYTVKESWLKEIFEIFDRNLDGNIDREEFAFCWNNWIKTIVKPVSALLVIDVQNDFICGTLDIRNCAARHNGEDVVQPINNLLDTVQFDAIFYSFDWHPEDHVSFIDNVHLRPFHPSSPVKAEQARVYDTVRFDGDPPRTQKLWPRHCVQNTWGGQLHKDLKVAPNAVKIYKGTNPEVDSYSAFWDNSKLTDTKMEAQLKLRNVTDVYVCGIAYDVCVGATAADAIVSGFRTILLDDCCRGVDLLDIEKTKENILGNNGLIATSEEVEGLVKGVDRRVELGYKLALDLSKRLASSKQTV